ncbi:hypothetical protein [Cytobacillus purgationiresistens]|uniref:Membrane protein n=1 Tax=Cytobacillus purgationiresistens TaxID=863449 RepID=A0ABU0AQS1_9BACI|nr:hypothetical protein [Cytobacillus purgationiresistens]MDQ0273565.1 putative membrane protein [Cytobacillus purgationiresistens]
MKIRNFGNYLIILGLISSLVGLVYRLGYTDSSLFKYLHFVGIIMFAIGIFLDMILKTLIKNKER